MPKEKQKPNWLSIGDAAEFLGISPDTLRRWEKKDKIKPFRSPTNRRYYTKKQLKAAMLGKIIRPKAVIKEPEKARPITKPKPPKTKSKKPAKGKKIVKLLIVSLGSLLFTAAIAFMFFFFFL